VSDTTGDATCTAVRNKKIIKKLSSLVNQKGYLIQIFFEKSFCTTNVEKIKLSEQNF
jgi:hypothetical protein